MGPTEAIQTCLTKSFQFQGRATRSEFNWLLAFVLMGLIASEVLQSAIWGWTLKNGPDSRILTYVFLGVIALPLLASSVRRTQDGGLHVLILFVPALLFYANWEIIFPLSREFATLTQGSDILPGHIDNIFRDISSLLFKIQKYGFYAIALILIVIPTDGAAMLRAKLPQSKERRP